MEQPNDNQPEGDKPELEVDPDKMSQMLQMGCDEEKSKYALLITQNNVEDAVNLVFEHDLEKLQNTYESILNGDAEGEGEIDEAAQDQQDINNLMEMFSLTLQCKMVILVRTDLNMSVGKVAAQVGHAVLGWYKVAMMECPEKVNQWELISWPKIVLKVDSEEQMDEMREQADQAGIWNFIVQDAGRTEVDPGTKTVLAIGPDLNAKIDPITGSLALLK